MVLKGNVHSIVLNCNTGISIVTPRDILSPGEKYRVCYLLHGLGGNSDDWVDKSMLSTHSRDLGIIFVIPEVSRSFYTDMKYGYKYFEYVARELPEIAASYFNISSRREDTAVMGLSMGGYGALKCALTYPEFYGFCGAFSSGMLYLKEYLDTQRGKEKLHYEDFRYILGEELTWCEDYEITSLAVRAEKSALKPVIYSSCGTEDTLYESNARFATEMKERDFDFTFENFPGTHSWYAFDEGLRRALVRFSEIK